jgi:hypothetical protein
MPLPYQMRWDIETFYRHFKHVLHATNWHCASPASFQKELLMHMITFCLIRIAMLGASRKANTTTARLSFSRALTETRIFFRVLIASVDARSYNAAWDKFVLQCSLHLVPVKPNRHFSWDRQEYRKKSRGLLPKRKGRKA